MVIIPWSLSIIQTRYLRRCRRRTHRRLASGFVQYREWAASILDPDDPTIDQGVAQIRNALAFTLAAKDGSVNSAAANGGSRFDSPRGYDPIKVRESFERLFDRLRKSLAAEAVK